MMPVRVLMFKPPSLRKEPEIMEWLTFDEVQTIAEDHIVLAAEHRLNNPEVYTNMRPSEIVCAIAHAVGMSVQEELQNRVKKATRH